MLDNKIIDFNYNEFINLLKTNVTRDGVDALLKWIESSDAKTAPASTKYHCSYAGGLLEHTLNVYNRLCDLINFQYGGESPYTRETITLVALLHDLSKVNFYEISYRNVKDESGNWIKVPFYQTKEIKDRFTYGSHAMNSLYIAKTFIKLTYDEELAILYHMGGFDYTEDSISVKNISEAFSKSPLALLLHQADMQATYLDEVKSE